jgi:hypothetical protein
VTLTAVAPALQTRDSAGRVFLFTLGAALALKLVFAALLPLTGDEAYFVLWGEHLDYGYYDHGGMTGWWIGLTLLAGKSALLLRLPAVFTSLLGALVLRAALRPVDAVRADVAATLYLLSPATLFNVFITTEIPLLFFSLFAVAFAIRATRRESLMEWLLAGFFLGLAILSKYLAVLLGIAFVIHLLVSGGTRRFHKLMTLFAGAIPGIAVNLAWNLNHGCANIVFNVFTRHNEVRFSVPSAVAFALLVMLVFAGPILAYPLVRRHTAGQRTWRETWTSLRDSGTLVAFYALSIPLAVLLTIALIRSVGLHWLFSFYPWFFLVLAAKFDLVALQRQVRPMMVYASACFVVVLVLLALPVEILAWQRSYNSVVLGTHPDAVLARIEPYAAEYTLVTPSYTQSAQLSYHSGRYVPVIGPGSHHGRQDDFITDFRAFDGRNLMVLSSRGKDAAATHAFFESVEAREIEIHGARIAFVLGRGFKYAAYHDAVLRRIAHDYYRMPGWLARLSKPAPFIVRYGLESAVARNTNVP